MKQYVVENITYRSLRDVARAYGKNYDELYNRIERIGWSVEEAVGLVKRRTQQGTKVTLQGTTYDSISDAARAYNLNPGTVISRLRNGVSLAKAFNLPETDADPEPVLRKARARHEKVRVEIDGVIYTTRTSAAKACGLSPNVVNARVNRDWTLEEALGLTERHPRYGYPGIIYKITNIKDGKVYIGVTMRSLETRWQEHVDDAFDNELANSQGSLREAIVIDGPEAFTREIIAEANNHVEMQRLEIKYIAHFASLRPAGYNGNIGGSGCMFSIKHAIKVNGKNYSSIAKAIDLLGIDIPYQTIVYRISHLKWTPDEAFGFIEHVTDKSNWGASQRPITVSGVTYRSVAEACRCIPNAPDPKLVQSRLSRPDPWTPDEAFGLVPHEDQRGKHSPTKGNLKTERVTTRNTSGYRGVSLHKGTGKWQAAFNYHGQRHSVGLFDTAESAYDAIVRTKRALQTTSI